MTVPEKITPKTTVWSSDDLNSNPHQSVDKPERVERMFSAIARKYDLNNRLHSLWQDQIWRQKTVKAANLSIHDEVVDVACGTGDLAMAFCREGAKSVIGVDFTHAMLEIAIDKAREVGLEIDYRQGDAMKLNLADESADIVSIAFGIRNVLKPQVAFNEFYRILRPSGRLVVLEFSTPKNNLMRKLNNFYIKKIMPTTATVIAQDRSGAYKYLPKSVETFSGPEELAKMIEKSGFSNINHQPLTFGVCTITAATKIL
ncbi:MAG: bifunctional demethylmenaquinone methyltransferase/2-methoxy-6-polyprenyl-1,4-benzoquinol methylase UbiE [Phycisphaerales bacterium]|nr:bifunctional demethylmenaquinone methyltransferase/2-methoxy-6-polyprenyl-1,4-benzoquinol methylase UbiE [Phycisphaerales bacterium]